MSRISAASDGATPSSRTKVLRFVAAFGLLTLVTMIIGALFKAPVLALSKSLVAQFGHHGLALGMLVTEASPVPIVNEPLLFFAHAGGMSMFEVWLLAGLASFASGPIGYSFGRTLGRRPRVHRWIERAGLGPEIARRGATFVAIAAITPLPFAVCCWTAGASGASFWPFLAACTGRLAKIGVVVLMIAGGQAAFLV